jgi:hypothetical protein
LPKNFGGQLTTTFGAATTTQTTELIILHHAAMCLYDLIENTGEELNVVNDALAGWGDAPRTLD